jgi:hypothetical protein
MIYCKDCSRSRLTTQLLLIQPETVRAYGTIIRLPTSQPCHDTVTARTALYGRDDLCVYIWVPELYRKQNLVKKNAVFWDVTQCRSCKNRRFRGTYRLLASRFFSP